MNEVQRQQYLEALGIDSYMPRWILPMAPRSVACAAVVKSKPAAASDVYVPASRVAAVAGNPPAAHSASVAATAGSASASVSASLSPSQTSPASAAVGMEALAAVTEQVSVTPTPVIEAPARRMTDTAAVVDPRFALSMWRVSEELLVIDSRQAQLALPTEPLLANILQALGLPRQPLQRAEVLHWPMYDHPLAPKGEAAARETLMAMLEAKLEQHPVPYLLLMGAEACHFVLPAELLPSAAEGEGGDPSSSFAALEGKALRVEPLKATAIVVPSLCDMLQQPALKASTWRAIQPLRQV